MMTTSGDIWFAFFKTAGTLLLVIAVLVIFLKLIRRFSPAGSSKGNAGHIQIISVHHFAPKEKLILVQVLDRRLLLGVTPSRISTISSFDGPWEEDVLPDSTTVGFQNIFAGALARPLGRYFKDGAAKGGGDDQDKIV